MDVDSCTYHTYMHDGDFMYVDCPWILSHTPPTTAGMKYFKNSLIYIKEREREKILLLIYCLVSAVCPVGGPWLGLGRRWCSTIAILVPEAFYLFPLYVGDPEGCFCFTSPGRWIHRWRREVKVGAVRGRCCCKRAITWKGVFHMKQPTSL